MPEHRAGETRELAPSISRSLTIPESGHPKGELRMELAHIYNLCESVTENAQGNDPVQEFMIA